MYENMPVETRKQAAALGKKKFRPGKNCPRGHESLYYVATGGCIRCNKERAREAQRIQRKAMRQMQSTNGMTDLTVTVHQQDAETVKLLAAQLNAARGLPVAEEPAAYVPKHQPNSLEGINEYYGNTRTDDL